jgi:hypothetical protein
MQKTAVAGMHLMCHKHEGKKEQKKRSNFKVSVHKSLFTNKSVIVTLTET